MSAEPVLVAGEPAHLVLDAMHAIRERGGWNPADDGFIRIDVKLDALDAGPLARALMRVEAELLLQEADALTLAAHVRTDEQRRGDAFLLLARRVCEAVTLRAA